MAASRSGGVRPGSETRLDPISGERSDCTSKKGGFVHHSDPFKGKFRNGRFGGTPKKRSRTVEQDQGLSTRSGLDAVVQRANLRIIRDALLRGSTRFSDFQKDLEMSPERLTERLNALVESGLMGLRPGSSNGKEHEYVLTPMGRDLEPVVIALTIWDMHWISPTDARPSPGPAASAHSERTSAASGQPPLEIKIQLLGTFAVRVGEQLLDPLSTGSQRLLAFLALQDRAVARVAMAGAMWPDATDRGAGISLRSALSRLDAPTRAAILAASAGLSLEGAVIVDLREAQALAHRLLRPERTTAQGDLSAQALNSLSAELLPDWYDNWAVSAAEDWRQLRVSALEAQSRILLEQGRLADAAAAARAAMKVDYLRESAQASLIRVHLAEGNQSEALRVFEHYRMLLHDELRLMPTTHLTDLIASIRRP
jgi:DNA-binding HxlR family transcriptional regulator/DNA-binding SARP family transcriptional activator